MSDDAINNELLTNGFTYDGTSDFGRIDRQTSFLRAMFERVKSKLDNPIAMNGFLENLPKGITIDDTFSLNELIGLALKFHGYNSNSMQTYTLDEVPAVVGGADVEVVQEPYAEQQLVNIFGSSLLRPTNPPPNAAGVPQMPPVITPTTTTTLATTTTTKHHKAPVTTPTINPTLAEPSSTRCPASRTESVQLVEPLDKGVPRQSGALDAHREFDDTLEAASSPSARTSTLGASPSWARVDSWTVMSCLNIAMVART